MKKSFLILSLVVVILAGVTSCEDNKSSSGDVPSGNLTIEYGFRENIPAPHAAASTDVVPITTWKNNIKSLMLLLVQSNKISRVISIPTQDTPNNSPISRTFNGIPVGEYDIYIVANWDQKSHPFGIGSIISTPAFTASTLVGSDIGTLLFNLPKETPVGTADGDSNVVGEPSEVFLAKQMRVNVIADVTTVAPNPFQLVRAVSLLRVRINQVYDRSPANANNGADVIDFTSSGAASVRIRRHGLGLKVAEAANATSKPYGVSSPGNDENVFYSGKKFKTATDFVAAGYKAGANMGIDAGDFTLWNEYLILPGGNKETGAGSGATKFNVVLSGKTLTDTYVPADKKSAVPKGTTLYWVGQVTNEVAPNGILELNISPKSVGLSALPDVSDYGNLSVSVALVDWGTTTNATIPLGS